MLCFFDFAKNHSSSINEEEDQDMVSYQMVEQLQSRKRERKKGIEEGRERDDGREERKEERERVE